jgi:biopolymer transport protein ExbB
MNEMWDFLVRGGVLMIPIGIASVLGVAVVIERFVALASSRIIPGGLSSRVISMMDKGETENTLKILANHPSPLGRLLNEMIINRVLDRRDMTELLEEKGQKEAHRMARGVDFIGVLAAISPLLGLLGTVTGMISVFRGIMQDATIKGINPASLASGIWEALITTAAGLAVAIPLFLAYRYLGTRVESLVMDMEEEVETVLDHIKPRTSATPEVSK